MSSAGSDNSWSLTIRLSSGDRFVVDVMANSSTVGSTKAAIASAKSELAVERQRLVYKGRILDDNDRLLTDYGVVDQATLFLVLSTTTTTTSTSGGGGTTSSTTGSSMGSGSSVNINTSASNANTRSNHPTAAQQQQLQGFGAGMPDANQMRDMLNSPMMQGLLNNPEMMQNAMQMSLQANPQLRQLMESNPELRQVMQDPAMMQQAMQMMRNPDALQQAMRSQDLAMSQLENLPGGFAALSSMYRNIQEPLMEAHIQPEAPTARTSTTNATGEGATGVAMPNPWGSSATSSTSNSTSTSSGSATTRNLTGTTRTSNNTIGTAGGMPNPWDGGGGSGIAGANMFNPWAAGGAGAGAGMMPGMQGMINSQPPQNAPNLDQVTQILDNPMMMNMMQQMVDSNPDMIRQMMEAQNPMLRQMFAGQSPEQANQFIRQMMNPQNLRNMMQLQQSMAGMGAGAGTAATTGMMPPFMPAGSGGASPGGLDFSNLLGGAASAAGGVGVPRGGPSPAMDFGALMQNMQFGGGAGPGGMFFPPPSLGASSQQQQQQQQHQHPADRFRLQLQSLRDMGFDDEQANLAALQQTHGNLNRAVDQLLLGPPSLSAGTPAPPASVPASSSSSAPSPAPSAPITTTNNNSTMGDPAANAPSDDTPKDEEDKKND